MFIQVCQVIEEHGHPVVVCDVICHHLFQLFCCLGLSMLLAKLAQSG
jgi:hypothetical protein